METIVDQTIAKFEKELRRLKEHREYVEALEEEKEQLKARVAELGKQVDEECDCCPGYEDTLNQLAEIIKLPKAPFGCDGMSWLCVRLVDAIKELAIKLEKPGRVLTDEEIDVAYKKFRGDRELANRGLVIKAVVRWAIAESRPAVCGATAEEVREKAIQLYCRQHTSSTKDGEDFAEWLAFQVRPVAEVTGLLEERIEELKADFRAKEKLQQATVAFIGGLNGRLSDLAGERDRLQNQLREQTNRAERAEDKAAMKAGEFMEELCMSREEMKEWVAEWMDEKGNGSKKVVLQHFDGDSPNSFAAGAVAAINALAGRLPKPDLVSRLLTRIKHLERPLPRQEALEIAAVALEAAGYPTMASKVRADNSSGYGVTVVDALLPYTRPQVAELDKRWYTDEEKAMVWRYTKDGGVFWYKGCFQPQLASYPETQPELIRINKTQAGEIRKGWKQ